MDGWRVFREIVSSDPCGWKRRRPCFGRRADGCSGSLKGSPCWVSNLRCWQPLDFWFGLCRCVCGSCAVLCWCCYFWHTAFFCCRERADGADIINFLPPVTYPSRTEGSCHCAVIFNACTMYLKTRRAENQFFEMLRRANLVGESLFSAPVRLCSVSHFKSRLTTP